MMLEKFKKNKKLKFLSILFIALVLVVIFLDFYVQSKKDEILALYERRNSIILTDRKGENILVKENPASYYSIHTKEISDEFKEMVVKKEDRFFYFHPGINLGSIVRALWDGIFEGKNFTSSTITQQLAKIFLGNEFDRTIKNKIDEAIFSIFLEIDFSKDEILTMYLNSIYFGNRVEGVQSASLLYFDKQAIDLDKEESLQLLATISNPSNLNPFTIKNLEVSQGFGKMFDLSIFENKSLKNKKSLEEKFQKLIRNDDYFELQTLKVANDKNERLAVDLSLTDSLREILKRNLNLLAQKDVTNGAIVVIKTGTENELLSIVGSPDPSIHAYENKINMATRFRPIGSTVKPFIYLKGFENGLRPYSRVEDKEYKYTIGSGFAFYPKNYDYEYRGEVDLHYALSNSLNVPTVKVLEYEGLENFYDFLLNDLEFKSIQELKEYQLGIALGGLEMDLLSLSYYFTIFSQAGELKPLTICLGNSLCSLDGKDFSLDKKIAEEKYIQLVTKIISDRKTGIEQFGMKSNLNLLFDNYAVKTGTSREYHDSWAIGYTPDFVVGTWVGNSDDTAMENVSGQSGAGNIWHEVMNFLYNGEYYTKNRFEFDEIESFEKDGNLIYGLIGDKVEDHYSLLLEDSLIQNPHNEDQFLMEDKIRIPLKAREEVVWKINDEFIIEAKETVFSPKKIGKYKIEAIGKEKQEIIFIKIEDEE